MQSREHAGPLNNHTGEDELAHKIVAGCRKNENEQGCPETPCRFAQCPAVVGGRSKLDLRMRRRLPGKRGRCARTPAPLDVFRLAVSERFQIIEEDSDSEGAFRLFGLLLWAVPRKCGGTLRGFTERLIEAASASLDRLALSHDNRADCS